MKVVVLDAGTLGVDIDLSPLKDNFETIVYRNTAPDEIESRVKDADVIVINKIKINTKTLGNSRPKLVCLAATGFDNVDIDFCQKEGIGVCNVVGYSTDSVAQLTITQALYLLMHMPEYTDYVNSGDYTKSGIANKVSPTFHTLKDKTWGIVGLGNIGKKVAEIAKAFGCKVIVNKRTPAPDFECVSLETLCKQSDVISLHTPLTPETKHIINEKTLSMMKPECVLINVARGLVCDEEAVANAVLNKQIAAFGTDVYSFEPFPETHPMHKLRNLPNVCLTPHMAWASLESRNLCMEEIRDNILSFQQNQTRNRVDI